MQSDDNKKRESDKYKYLKSSKINNINFIKSAIVYSVECIVIIINVNMCAVYFVVELSIKIVHRIELEN